MITVFTWNTPNGQKPLLLLEELGESYKLEPVNLSQGSQNSPHYLKINPNGKIPALVEKLDGQDITIFESEQSCSISRKRAVHSGVHRLQSEQNAPHGCIGRSVA